MSIVPVLAMALAIARGFGYSELLRQELFNRFQDQNEALTQIFQYADNFLDQAKSGIIAGFGFALLFLTVILLLRNLEGILNGIWGVKKLRSWRRVLTDYFAVVLIAPVIFVIASSVSVFVVDILEKGIRLLPASLWAISWLLFLVHLVPYCLFALFFTFLYLFMPNTKVHFASALLGGVIAGCLYTAVQWGYIYFQVGVSRYGAVYGSMAALPLFLVWLQLSWFIVLFGAEVSCAHQTMDEHEFEVKAGRISYSFKRLLTLWILHLALKGFLTRERLVKHYQVPSVLATPILQELVACHLLHETRGGYVAGHHVQNLKISEVIAILEERGENAFPFIEARSLAPFERALRAFCKMIESSPENIQLSDTMTAQKG